MNHVANRLCTTLSCVLWLSTLTHCTSNPRNGQHLDDIENIDVNGLVPWANDPATGQPGTKVHLDVFDASHNTWFDDGVPATADTTPSTTDSGGTAWYHFTYNLQAPLPEIWVGSLSKHTTSMKFRTYVQGQGHTGNSFDSAHDIALASLDTGDATDQCLRDHQSEPGAQIIQACGSKASDITVFADCGTQGKLCCGTGWPESTNYQCDSGLRCDWQGKCGSCGGAGQLPCHGTQCYALSSGGQRCHLQCDTGAYDGQHCIEAANPPPPPPPPATKTRVPHDSSVNCALQPFWTGDPLYACTVLEDPTKQAKLVSITNPLTAFRRNVIFVKDPSNATSVCSDVTAANPDQVYVMGPGQSADMQSVLGSQPAINGSYTYALCVVPTMPDDDGSAYISNYTESYIP